MTSPQSGDRQILLDYLTGLSQRGNGTRTERAALTQVHLSVMGRKGVPASEIVQAIAAESSRFPEIKPAMDRLVGQLQEIVEDPRMGDHLTPTELINYVAHMHQSSDEAEELAWLRLSRYLDNHQDIAQFRGEQLGDNLRAQRPQLIDGMSGSQRTALINAINHLQEISETPAKVRGYLQAPQVLRGTKTVSATSGNVRIHTDMRPPVNGPQPPTQSPLKGASGPKIVPGVTAPNFQGRGPVSR